MKKVLIILGPTATGKTDIALDLAKKFDGEIISCDSRQVYIGLDIGTGKLPTSSVILSEAKNLIKGEGFWEMDRVKVWMLDIADPKKRYTIFNYVKDAKKILEDILKRNKLPIIVGGTGFYLKALLEGLSNLNIPIDEKLRKKLEKYTVLELQNELRNVSVEKFDLLNNSDKNDPRRLVRAIELLKNGSPIMSRYNRGHSTLSVSGMTIKNYDVLKIGLTARKEIIGKRIRDRVLKRLNEGMIEEVENLHKRGLSFSRMKELGLEYSVIADYLNGVIKSKEELINVLKIKIGQYAKRQITWFKREEYVSWFDITEKDCVIKVEKKIGDWYNLADAK